MITVQEIDRQLSTLDGRVSALKTEADALAFDAVSGEDKARSRIAQIRAELAAADADRQMFMVARDEAERREREARDRARAEARRAARGEARQVVREQLLALAKKFDQQTVELLDTISELEAGQKQALAAFIKAGRPFSGSYLDNAAGEAQKRIESLFDPRARLKPLGDLLEAAWSRLFEVDDDELDNAAMARQAHRPDRSSEALAAEVAENDEVERQARIAYEAEPIDFVTTGRPKEPTE